MRFFLLIMALFSLSSLAQTPVELKHQLKILDNPEPQVVCDEPRYKSVKVISDESVDISIVTMEKLNEAFLAIREQKNTLYTCNRDGCFARAHKMVKELDKMGIESGKFYAEGRLMPENVFQKENEFWQYHVAPFVFVEVNGKLKLHVLDPCLDKGPMSADSWLKAMTTNPEAKLLRTYVTRKQNVIPNQKYRKQQTYSEKDDQYVEAMVKKFKQEIIQGP